MNLVQSVPDSGGGSGQPRQPLCYPSGELVFRSVRRVRLARTFWDHVLLSCLTCICVFFVVVFYMYVTVPRFDRSPEPKISKPALSVFIPAITVVFVATGMYFYKMAKMRQREEDKKAKFEWHLAQVAAGFLAVLIRIWYIHYSQATKVRHQRVDALFQSYSVTARFLPYMVLSMLAMAAAKLTFKYILCENFNKPKSRRRQGHSEGING